MPRGRETFSVRDEPIGNDSIKVVELKDGEIVLSMEELADAFFQVWRPNDIAIGELLTKLERELFGEEPA